MKKIVSILIGSVLLAFVTIGGLAVLGMEMGDSHMVSREGSVDCLEHCLSVASAASTGITSAIVSTIAFVILLALLSVAWQSSKMVSAASTNRWREGIWKRFHHRELAVVRIQD